MPVSRSGGWPGVVEFRSASRDFDRHPAAGRRRQRRAADSRVDRGDVARPPLAEAEIGPDPDLAGRQALLQGGAGEFRRRKSGEPAIEAQQADLIRAQLEQPFDLGAGQEQAWRRIGRGEKFPWQRFEAHHQRAAVQLVRAHGHLRQQRLVAAVQAIERAHGDRTAAGRQARAGDIPGESHHRASI